jgi:dTDP-4-dehydrorhamnose 3,5-epimerase
MLVTRLALPEVLELTPAKQGDARGFFSETFNARRFIEAGITLSWVQDNHSYSASKGVLRGLHYQIAPFAQDKLVRVIRGSIFDVAVDIRRGSPTFGRWCSLVVSAAKWNQILVPKCFAHGFLTLEPDTEVIYKVSEFYDPEHDRAVHYADADIGIDWPLNGAEPILSAKDRSAPLLRDVEPGFFYQPVDGASA